jgi:peptidoglycan/LPS O-acetylase OafA/YrhL
LSIAPDDATAPREWFPCIDGYRALAAMAVLALHVSVASGLVFRKHTLGLALSRLDVGVAVFFLISGFLLYRPFVSAHLIGRAPMPMSRYFRARALRIFPAYWLALTFAVYVFHQPGAKHQINNVGDFVSYYGLLQQYTRHHSYGGIQQAWTLCVELAFYLFLPLYAWAVRRVARRVGRAVLVEIIGLVTLSVVSLAWHEFVSRELSLGLDHLHSWLPGYLGLFALGMGLALISARIAQQGTVPRVITFVGDMPVLCWGAAACTYWITATQFDVGYPHLSGGQWMAWIVLYGLTALLLLLPGVFGPQDRGIIRRVLRWRPIVFLGLISYGVYLWHELWIDKYLQWSDRHLFNSPVWPMLAVVVALSVVAATISYYVVERPALRFKRGAGARGPKPSERPVLR